MNYLGRREAPGRRGSAGATTFRWTLLCALRLQRAMTIWSGAISAEPFSCQSSAGRNTAQPAPGKCAARRRPGRGKDTGDLYAYSENKRTRPGRPCPYSDKELNQLITVSWRFRSAYGQPVWFLTWIQTGLWYFTMNTEVDPVNKLRSCGFNTGTACDEIADICMNGLSWTIELITT